MRLFTSIFGVLLLLINWTGPAQADVLVSSFDSFQVLQYDDAGAFIRAFATGKANDRPLGMTMGADGNLYVGMNNFGPPFESFIRRFNGQTGAFIDTFASGSNLLNPHQLVFGPEGDLYVASFGNTAPKSRVSRYDGETGAFIDDFIPAGNKLKGVEALLFAPDNTLYVTSRSTGQVQYYEWPTGTFLGDFDTKKQMGPIGLVYGPLENMYVLNSTATTLEVLRLDVSTGTFDVFVNGFSGGTDGSNLVFGPDGNLYVTTGWIGNSVRRFDGSTGQLIDEFIPPGNGGLAYATGLLFRPPNLQLIPIKIKPGGNNEINPNSNAIILVAILTTDSFDATTVDSNTVYFGATGTEASPVSSAREEDVDEDGKIDMTLKFNTQDTDIKCGDTSAFLTGKTLGGQAIEGADSIVTKECF